MPAVISTYVAHVASSENAVFQRGFALLKVASSAAGVSAATRASGYGNMVVSSSKAASSQAKPPSPSTKSVITRALYIVTSESLVGSVVSD